MAKEVTSPERKRGRSSIASRPSDASQTLDQPSREKEGKGALGGEDGRRRNVEGQAQPPRPTTRGRKRKSLGPKLDEEEESLAQKPSKKPRTKPATEKRPQAVKEEEKASVKRKRGRTSLDGTETKEPEKKKRGRPSVGGKQEETSKGNSQPISRGRRRPLKSPEDVVEKPGRHSGVHKNEIEGEREDSKPSATRESNKPATRKSNKPATKESKKPATKEPATKEPATRKLATREPATREPATRKPATRKTPKKQPDPEQAADQPPASPSRPYVHIATKTQTIKPFTVNSKWSSLTNPSLIAASSILDIAKYPILQRMSTTSNRRVHTTEALHLITKRIARKLSRGLPFPPSALPATTKPNASSSSFLLPGYFLPAARGTKPSVATDSGRAAEFNLERVLDARKALERQLEPALSAVEVLRREKGNEERQLKMDYELLRRLESDAKVRSREQRGLLKKAHVLAPEGRHGDGNADEDVKVVDAGHVFRDTFDEEIRSLAVQLHGHVESMTGNLNQVDGLTEQIAQGRAALQDVLLSHLGSAEYEKVLFGQQT